MITCSEEQRTLSQMVKPVCRSHLSRMGQEHFKVICYLDTFIRVLSYKVTFTISRHSECVNLTEIDR